MEENLSHKRHSLAHILAQAVQSIYSMDISLAFGPATENGFYYDFDFWDIEIKESDLKAIEKKMKQIIKQNQSFNLAYIDISDGHLSRDEAHFILKDWNQKYKTFQVDNLYNKDPEVRFTFYENINQKNERTFIDLCQGWHVDNTNQIDPNSFTLTRVSGAYWLGDENNKMLTRISWYAFNTWAELQDYLTMLREAKKRDHRVLGKKLKLFTISPLVGSGLPLLQPAWAIMKKELEDYLWDLHKTRWYERIWTPHIAKEDLYIKSWHRGHYLDDMFLVFGWTSKEKFHLKPMNCPHHIQIFQDNQFSYRDLPIRYFEPATVYRDEKAWELSGLTRVRSITQDDGHLFCRVDQIAKEVSTIAQIIKEFYTTMWLIDDYWVSLSVRDTENLDNYLWSESVWQEAERALESRAKLNDLPYKKVEWEARFYGPKLDFMFKDAIWREWQLATIQCDFNLPERFELSFKNESGEDERPVMIHRAIAGSFERFMWLIIENFAWLFPLWLSPRQVQIISVSDKFDDYATKVKDELVQNGIRASIDHSQDSFSKKIRSWELDKYNYIVIVWEEEEKNTKVSFRDVKTKDKWDMSLDDFKNKLKDEINKKAL